jgi:hypothetical protein
MLQNNNEGIVFTDLGALVPFARLRAMRGLYDGHVDDRSMSLMRLCTHRLRLSPEHGALLIFTRDIGHHTGGWWKNPDYERCWHLSISYRQHHEGPHAVDRMLDQDKAESERIARAFFGDDARLLWCEPPYSEPGKRADVWHYRLFCGPSWHALKPRGEVYSRADTPAGWKSFSDLHGFKPATENAPFFAQSSE